MHLYNASYENNNKINFYNRLFYNKYSGLRENINVILMSHVIFVVIYIFTLLYAIRKKT